MSDTPTPDAPAPDAPPVPGAPLAATQPPETKPPEPEARASFVLLKPFIDGDRALNAGILVSLTATQAKAHAALVREATARDLAIYGRAPVEL